MTLDDWYVLAASDADRRSLPELTPVLKGLHGAAKALRAAPWNDDARGSTFEATDLTASQSSEPAQPPQPSQPSQSTSSPSSSSSSSSQTSPRASS